jgi:hypothetical protein
MSINNEFREQLDACRPGSGDLTLAELAGLAQAVDRMPAIAEELARSQRFDRQIAAALHDLPLPPDLVDRLLHSAQAAAAEGQGSAAVSVAKPIATPNEHERDTRRRWLIAGSVALATIVAAPVYLLFRSQRRIAPEELAKEVVTWLDHLPPSAWQATAKLPVAIDRAVIGRPTRWQRVSPSGWSSSVTAVDLAGPGRPRAILFVVNSSATFVVPATPTPEVVLRLSGGLSATAWQRQNPNTLFVLVVEGSNQRLDDFLRPLSAA